MRKIILIIFLIFASLTAIPQGEEGGDFQFLTGYSNDIFTKPYQRELHVFYSGVGYKTDHTAIYGKVNYGLLVPDARGYQFELDYYQDITTWLFGWANYAYSECSFFPNHRAMVRLWQKLPAGFLISEGLNYYYFDRSLYTVNLGLEKYMGNFWVEGLVYLHFKEPDPRFSYKLSGRYFWQDYNYIQLSLMTGAAQDEPWTNGGLLPSTLNAHSAGLTFVSYLGQKKKVQLRANVGYAYEEYAEGSWRNRYTSGLGFVFTF